LCSFHVYGWVYEQKQIPNLSESRFRIHIADCYIDEDVNDAQFLGMAAGHTSGLMPEEIFDQIEGKLPAFLICVGYV
jgi:hypothetical protein